MAEPLLNETTIEQREDYMVSPTGSLPTRRIAYFLRPMVTSIEGPPLKLPSLTQKPKWPLKVYFNGWRDPLRKWKSWVESMHPRYSSVWKNAGIYDAIMGSIHKIHRDNDLVFGIAERWCSETNTFLFPWGEATVTLEDMLILGGFSVLGDPVLLPLETNKLVEIEGFLDKSRRNLGRTKTGNHVQWLNLFMDCGSEFEHEAFLSLWLSRFVFPGNHLDKIGKHVFAIAIHLARGRQLALGPAVLASIYRDLGLLKEAMAESTRLTDDGDSFSFVALWSPLALVQVWAWERLPVLQPEPNMISLAVVRLARWDGVKISKIGNVRPAIESAGVTFLWRPYALAVDNWSFPSFYKEKEEFFKGENLGVELESFARCLRASQLVGIDCQEPYNPHRVAMQFGFDQDLPAWIPRESMDREIAWYIYSKSISDDEILYLPPRLFESDVTTRYLEWWRKTVLCPVHAVKGLMKRRRSPRKVLKLTQDSKRMLLSCDPNVPPESQTCGKHHRTCADPMPSLAPHSSNMAHGEVSQVKLKSSRNEYLQKLIRLKTENDLDVPPGFPPRSNGVKTTDYSSMIIRQPHKERSPSCDDVVSPAVNSQCHLGSLEKFVTKNEVVETMVSPAAHSQCHLGSLEEFVTKNEVVETISKVVAFFESIKQLRTRNDPDVPPGFPPKGDCNSALAASQTHRKSCSKEKRLPCEATTCLELQQVINLEEDIVLREVGEARPIMAAESSHERLCDNSSNFKQEVVSDIGARIAMLEMELDALRNSD